MHAGGAPYRHFAVVAGFWLTVLLDNARARHVYASHGFVEEGVLRGAFRFADGRRGDLVMMSVLRPDWLARLRGACE